MTWTSLHVRLSWTTEHVDAFIADTLAPALAEHRAAGRIADWFFLRYWSTGPHLRIRLRDATTDLTAQLRHLVSDAGFPEQSLDPERFYASLGTSGDDWLPHGDVREVPYEPEVHRYGGPQALPVAEQVFCRSTDVAVAVLRAARTPGAKISAAVELVMATTIALKMDRLAAASWLRTLASGWRQGHEPSTPPTLHSHVAARKLHEQRAADLSARWDRLESHSTGAVAFWMDQVRPDLPTYVWASQLHMLLNRLGIGPDEERTVCWLVAQTAGSPNGVTPFHQDGASAPDRRYLEASKFLSGVEEQGPRKGVVPSRPPVLPWHEVVTLPPASAPSGSLADALSDRHTSRGEQLTGPLSAGQLATLLWTAQGALPGGRRPYPSAGALHTARLRLIAWQVSDLAPGVYDVDETRRVLVRIAPAPSTSEVTPTSMWFGPRDDGVALTTTPALLALYVRAGELRRFYGLRALRLTLVEAGHLAQNLALVAQSAGLSLGMIGGFYDDMAHDVLGLDGVNDTLVYLMPVSSAPQVSG